MTRKENAPVKGRGNYVADVHNTTAKNTATQSRAAQCADLLKWMQGRGRITTLQARNDLGIMHPAARIQELREAGHTIKTYRQWQADATGKQHKQGLYVLMTVQGGAS